MTIFKLSVSTLTVTVLVKEMLLFLKMMIAYLNNGLLPQHVLCQVILRNHMEMSVALLLSGISDTAHLSSWTSETLLICFLV